MKDRKGITLIELIMVIMIVGILTSVSSMYIKETIDLWRFLSFRSELVSVGRMALARMTREIRQVRDDLSVYIAEGSRFQFDDVNGNNITYSRADASCNYDINGGYLCRNNNILTSGVNSLTFTYYNESNQDITAQPPLVSPEQTDIYRIELTLQIQSGTQTKTLKSQVFPRNF